jgi:hypothetical protein
MHRSSFLSGLSIGAASTALAALVWSAKAPVVQHPADSSPSHLTSPLPQRRPEAGGAAKAKPNDSEVASVSGGVRVGPPPPRSEEGRVRKMALDGDIQAALLLAATTKGDESVYSNLVAAAAQEFGKTSPEEAVRWVCSPNFGEMAIQTNAAVMLFDSLASRDAHEACRLLEHATAGLPYTIREQATAAVARRWAESDPDAALKWTVDKDSTEPFLSALEVWSVQDPAAAAAGAPVYLTSLPEAEAAYQLNRLRAKIGEPQSPAMATVNDSQPSAP